ncbi:MAG: autotransporter outer membrane beta-barrel domain-containing protein [Deltaproteobacteria bacterium]|jgi:hypothetical protein|nr:autotransporter outer membrane beta-barrel domain-containing protein [Deltaproteobacteria bacterium]
MKKLMTLALVLGLLGWALPSLAFDSRESRDRAFQDMSFKAMEQKAARFATRNQAPAAGEGSPMVVALVPEFNYSHHDGFHEKLNGVERWIESGKSKLGSMALVLTKPLNDAWSVYFLYQYSYSDYDGSNFTSEGDNIDLTDDNIDNGTLIGSQKRTANAYSQFIGLGVKYANPTIGNFDFNVVEAWNIYRSTTRYYDEDGNQLGGSAKANYDDRLTSMILYWDKDFKVTDTWAIDPYIGWRSVWAVVHGDSGESNSNATLWLHLVTTGVKVKYNAGNFGFYFRGGYNYRVSKDDIADLATRAVAPGVLHHGWFASYDRSVGTWGLGFNYNFGNGWFLDLAYNGMSGDINYVHSGTAVVVLPF